AKPVDIFFLTSSALIGIGGPIQRPRGWRRGADRRDRPEMKRLKSGCLRAVATLVALYATINAILEASPAQAVRLLDGTRVPPSKIERTVTRLMQAGRVT